MSIRWRFLWGQISRIIRVLFVATLFVFVVAPERPAFGNESYRLHAIVQQQQFDFLLWQIKALRVKAEAILSDSHIYMSAESRKMLVLEYLELVREIDELNWEIEQIFIDPEIADPQTASRQQQQALVEKRARWAEIQPLAEAIVQEQVATVLAAEGFSLAQLSWPPVMMTMTPVPSVLIVSPRDRIERMHQVQLVHGLPIHRFDEIETAVFEQLDLSALVVPIGGLGTYPAMIMETSNINWLLEVMAHEWSHHWLSFYPLGLNYGLDPQVRTINETVASIADVEIRDQVLARFYPEFVPPQPVAESQPALPTPEPPAFDFNAEMFATRVVVDRLLAEGEIAAAESYMEERRQLFVANGYGIRKLNQAYFAFYGAYAAAPDGAAGEDPIGPLLREIRAHSDSLYSFMAAVAVIDSFATLTAVHAEVTAVPPP